MMMLSGVVVTCAGWGGAPLVGDRGGVGIGPDLLGAGGGVAVVVDDAVRCGWRWWGCRSLCLMLMVSGKLPYSQYRLTAVIGLIAGVRGLLVSGLICPCPSCQLYPPRTRGLTHTHITLQFVLRCVVVGG